MNRDNFYVFMNESGICFGHCDNWESAHEYLGKAIQAGFQYTVATNGCMKLYTLIK